MTQKSSGLKSSGLEDELKFKLELESSVDLDDRAYKELGETPEKTNATLEVLRNLLEGSNNFS